MRLTPCLAVCLAVTMGCGPHATSGIPLGIQTTPTPVGWRVEPTATTVARATPTAVAAPTPPHAQPVVPRPTPPPTPTVVRPLAALPTPTPLPAIACQFDGRTFSVAAPAAESASHAGTSGLLTLASGEVLPGVSVELRLSATSFVAGAVIRPETEVRNTTTAPVTVSPRFSLNGGGAEIEGEPRSFPVYIRHSMPYSPGTVVAPGETWSVPSLVQLPFAAQRDADFQAEAGISGGQFVLVQAHLPLQLTTPTAAQELRLDLRADHEQWCLRATDAYGGTPTGPLFMTLQARSAREWAFVDPWPHRPGGPQAIWAGRWLSESGWQTESVAYSAWMGGEQYVTAHVDTGIPPER